MTIIATNISALRAQAASNQANLQMSTAMQRLSTGQRINSAKDDAAGLAITQSMTAQIRGMNQGIRNANDGISFAQTAEGALDEVGNMLQRMRELAVEALNGTYSDNDKANITAEQDALANQISIALQNTQFNGKNLFDGTSTSVTIQAGANSSDTVTMGIGNLVTDAAITKVVTMGTPGNPTATPPTTATDGKMNATPALEDFDAAIAKIANVRAGMGAAQNAMQSAVNNMTNNATNLTDARSRIQDADFSAESTNLAKAQILTQASTAMLAQANQSAQGVLKLLG